MSSRRAEGRRSRHDAGMTAPGLDLSELSGLAQRLRALHGADQPWPLVLANVWDPGTAKLVAAAGFSAVATSSAAVALSNGFADHEQMPADVAFAAVAAIVRAVPDLPVTADMESGYGLAPDEFARRLVESGAVGCNYEDTDHARPGALRPAEEQATRIAGIRAEADRLGVSVVINARVDPFVLRLGSANEQLAEAIRRGRMYLDAGADCIYPIVLSDEAAIATMVKETPGPVNILAQPTAPSVTRLAQLGVRRVSAGGGLYRDAIQAFRAGAAALQS
ncbi:MAG: hypothetical protein QOI20_291 [Acidimicrobiaceae bacterium]|nr:hypothetical protein [Acidimicrobiaceae bacterium]